jgi:23S rRNA pseudouridine2605 synthase
MANPGAIRLQKILSAGGVASRRAAEQLIREGRVAVNGEVVTTLGRRADPERDEIRVDGRRVRVDLPLRYFLVNKPAGYLSTRRDTHGRRTVLELLPHDHGYLFPVGRLDADSEGLLLLTNDGDLAARLLHPRHEVEREYEVTVAGVPTEAALGRLARGVPLDGQRTAPARVQLIKAWPRRARPGSLIRLCLREGRNRQVRRMCQAIGHPVESLRRIRIGPIADPRLPAGAVRALTPREVQALERSAGRPAGGTA